MTIMIESSRTFLFTEYARIGCGTLSKISTDPKVWDKLPVSLHDALLAMMLNFDAGQILIIPRDQGTSPTGKRRQGRREEEAGILSRSRYRALLSLIEC
jgi:hypothetical protein